jgi:hypothetical protein
MIATLPTTSHTDRPSWQCRFAGGQCTNPRVTVITGHVHELCEEHRLCKTPSTRSLADAAPVETSPDDWEYQPMSGGDWKLTSHDLAQNVVDQGRGNALADGVVFSSMFFHADVEALRAWR